MAQDDECDDGLPTWLSLRTSSPQVLEPFYASLFNWSFTDGIGHRRMGKLGRASIGELAPLTGGSVPGWLPYFASPDLTETSTRIQALGGELVEVIHSKPEGPVVVVFRDPHGAAFAVWERPNRRGCVLFGHKGAPSWLELSTRDISESLRFYGSVFPYSFIDRTQETGVPHVVALLGGNPRIGIKHGAVSEDCWDVYFGVSDVEDAAQRAVLRGGMMLSAVHEIAGFGRRARLVDPDTHRFGIIEPRSARTSEAIAS